MKEKKKALRKILKAQRDSISHAERERAGKEILRNITGSQVWQDAETILSYISFGSEADTRELISKALADGKTIAVPKCLPDSRMSFYIIESLDDCREGAYGIPEPMEHCREAELTGENIVCIVPGLAFGRTGERLGYGGGYYDRFLEKHPHIYTIGICSERFVIDDIPMEDTDQNLNCLVTEKTMEVNNGRENHAQ